MISMSLAYSEILQVYLTFPLIVVFPYYIMYGIDILLW